MTLGRGRLCAAMATEPGSEISRLNRVCTLTLCLTLFLCDGPFPWRRHMADTRAQFSPSRIQVLLAEAPEDEHCKASAPRFARFDWAAQLEACDAEGVLPVVSSRPL